MCGAGRGGKIRVLHAQGGAVAQGVKYDSVHNNSFIFRETAMRYLHRRLRSGTLAAHEKFRLVLLCSQPDTVHGLSLRKTQSSNALGTGLP